MDMNKYNVGGTGHQHCWWSLRTTTPYLLGSGEPVLFREFLPTADGLGQSPHPHWLTVLAPTQPVEPGAGREGNHERWSWWLKRADLRTWSWFRRLPLALTETHWSAPRCAQCQTLSSTGHPTCLQDDVCGENVIEFIIHLNSGYWESPLKAL